MSTLEVRDAPERSRYELLEDGRVVGFSDYVPLPDGTLVLPHTVVARDRRLGGYATRLVQGALDDVRRRGLRIVPECSFVADFLDSHPGYADLVASPPSAPPST